MLKHNLKISYRNLLRNRTTTFINVGGLVLGLCLTILVGSWIKKELSHDKLNDNYRRVARVMQQQTANGITYTEQAIPLPLVDEMRAKHGDDFEHLAIATWFGDYLFSKGSNAINIRGGFIESGGPEIMSLDMVQGTRKGLKEEASVLISESTAKAFFGDSDPLDQTLRVHNEVTVYVKGVYKDIPETSSFHRVAFVGSWDFYVATLPFMQAKLEAQDWNDNSYQLFALLSQKADFETVNEKIERVKYNAMPEFLRKYDTKILLHPMQDWYLRSSWENGVQSGGRIQYVRWFGAIGLFVLLLACVNFMNLSTAQSARRAKEVGVRKSIGSRKGQLIIQFLTESTLTVLISFLLAAILAASLVPFFEALTNTSIAVPVNAPEFWLIGLCFTLFLGVVAGSYPAWYLSSFEATQVLKGTYKNPLSAVLARKGLFVFQFTISVILIIFTLVVNMQIQHAIERPLGYEKSGMITVEMTSDNHYKKSDAIQNELLNRRLVSGFTRSSAPLTEIWTQHDNISWEGMDPAFQPGFATFFVDPSYGDAIGWNIIEGRDFSADQASDSSAVILNQAALDYMGIQDPLGMNIDFFKKFKVVGVIENMIVESPLEDALPSMYMINQGGMINFMLMRLNPELGLLQAVAEIEDVFKKHMPDEPFAFDFVSDVHGRKFQDLDRIANLSITFAILAIIISCLGLFGLVSFMAEQRTKEIGIRKVLGAPSTALWGLLSREFLALVCLASLIAIPAAIFGSNSWLENYSYRIELKWWIFAAASIGAIALTLLTVSFRSLRAIGAYPVDALKDE